jgi:hypothetical protein
VPPTIRIASAARQATVSTAAPAPAPVSSTRALVVVIALPSTHRPGRRAGGYPAQGGTFRPGPSAGQAVRTSMGLEDRSPRSRLATSSALIRHIGSPMPGTVLDPA